MIYKELKVWQKADGLAFEVYRLTTNYPKDEIYGLISQLRRAALSILLILFTPSTKNRRPLKLIYYEACHNQNDALKREKYLKTTYGKRYIKNRLKEYLTG